MKLEKLADDEAARIAEYRKRRSPYVEETIKAAEFDEYEQNGWTTVRKNKSGTIRVRKLKSVDHQLEDDCWCILYQMGYPVLNLGRKFSIPLGEGDKAPTKQIDVFAYDENTVVIFECKTMEKRGGKQLGPAIHEFSGMRKQISNTLRRHFGGQLKQRVIWAIVTRRISWSQADLDRAKEAHIHVVRDTEVAYFAEISRRIGRAARFQFQAEFLKSSKTLQDVKVFALRTTLGGETVYSFFAPASKILPLSFVNHRDLRDPEASPSYQRMVQKPRLKKIGEYLSKGGFFPNSIIVNFHDEVDFSILKPADESGIAAGVLTLPKNYKSIMIIDGQHRLYGYTQLEAGKLPDLQFLAFENLTVKLETKLFSDINFQQKTVSRKLLDEIAGEIKLDSDDPSEQLRAISSRCFDLMRNDLNGPLGLKISGADIKNTGSELLTLPSLNNAVEGSKLLGSVTKKGSEKLFLQGRLQWDDPKEAIDKLYRLLSSYFNLFREASVARWEAGKEGVFGRNVSVAGFILLLEDLIAHQSSVSEEDPRLKEPEQIVEDIAEFLEPMLELFRHEDLATLEMMFKVERGSQGPKDFQRKARFKIHDAIPDFLPAGLEQQLKESNQARTDAGDKLTRLIQSKVLTEITSRLRKHYKNGTDYLVDAGLPTGDFGDLASRQQDHRKKFGEKLDLETFVDFIKWKQIVQKPENWPLVEDVVSFNFDGKKNPSRKELTAWFDRMNFIRRIPAHPFGRDRYSDEEMDTLKQLYKGLRKRGIITDDIDIDAIP